jgi:hypothetical protein
MVMVLSNIFQQCFCGGCEAVSFFSGQVNPVKKQGRQIDHCNEQCGQHPDAIFIFQIFCMGAYLLLRFLWVMNRNKKMMPIK